MKNKKILFAFIIILILIFYNINKTAFHNIAAFISSFISNLNDSTNYEIIKQDFNKDYLGIGQERVENQDGYFTTFTTTKDNLRTYIEYKQNGNSSWSNKSYWGGTMEENGCGITSMSIILSGYRKTFTPEDLRKKYYPVLKSENISSELANTFGIKNSDFLYDSTSLSSKKIIEHLKSNRPILVCLWNNPRDNRWTTASHYMVLLAATDNMVYVSNPNGLENDSKSSGWYNINEITPYLAKVLYIESY